MSGLTSRLPRWRGRRTAARPAAVPPAPAPDGAHTVVEEFGTPHGTGGPAVFLLRSSADRRTGVRELAPLLRVERDRPVVVVDVAAEAAGNLGEVLGGLLARLRDERRTAARLVMSAAAARRPDGRLPLAQRLADAWELDIEAPDSAAVLVPGGGLYVCEPGTPTGGWWRFAPGAEPVALGARIPAPRWQRALARVPLGELGDCTVHQIPAGLLLRHGRPAAPGPGDPAFALAVHPDRPTVLVGAAGPGHDLAEDVATLLARLPADLRDRVRLAPGGAEDLLPVAQRAADLLGTEVEVCTGVPLPVPGPSGDGHDESVWLTSADGACAWPAVLASVSCLPAEPDAPGPAPRPVRWLLPDTLGAPGPEPAVRRLPEDRYVVAVRAGLWVGSSPTPPPGVRERPAEARAMRIEIEDPGGDVRARSGVLRALAALVPELDERVREHAEIAAPTGADSETSNQLRRFAVRSGLTFAAAPTRSGAAAPVSVSGDPLRSGAGPSVASAAREVPPEGPAHPGGGGPTTEASGPGAAVRPGVPAFTTGVATAGGPTEVGPGSTAEGPGADPTPAAAAGRPPTSGGPGGGASPEAVSQLPVPDPPGHVPAVRAGAGAARPPAVTAAGPGGDPTPEGEGGTGTVPPREQPDGGTGREESPRPAPVPAPAPRAPRPPVRLPVTRNRSAAPAPGDVSSGADRAAFRELAASVWEEYTGPVNQALVRLPALRGPGEEEARVDLVAVHLYLASPPDGRFGALALASEAVSGPGELAPYASCLASGLRRLPALRGPLLRAVAGPGIADDVVPGSVLRCDAPLDVVHSEQAGAPSPPEGHVRYAVKPMTARRTSMLTVPGGTGTTALFAAGTEFSVLARHDAAGERPARVLLAELPRGAQRFRAPSEAAVARLDEAALRDGGPSAPEWPARCTGPVPLLV